MNLAAASHPTLTELANQHGSDKGDVLFDAHHYTRVYAALLERSRMRPLRLLEIGLLHGMRLHSFQGDAARAGCPSLRMWAEYLPQAQIVGLDILDYRDLASDRIAIFRGDQGNRDELEQMIRESGGRFDVIIDDGSHASHHQQVSLGVLFRHLAPGGLYFIEDLHFQPREIEIAGITPTREFLRELRFGGAGSRVTLNQPELGYLTQQIRSLHFFDSQSEHWPLAIREDALAVIVKRGEHDSLDATAALGLNPSVGI